MADTKIYSDFPPELRHVLDDTTTCDQVFISYSHKDNEWLEKFKIMLRPMIREGLAVWEDTKIRAGQRWREEIQQALARAKVAVLMVSPDFLDSDFIYQHELPPLLDAAEKEGLTIIWIPVRHSLYEETEIKQYQAAHDPGKPLVGLNPAEQEEALVKICKQIKDAMAIDGFSHPKDISPHRHTFVSATRLNNLKTLLKQANLPSSAIQEVFDDCLSKIEPRRIPPQHCVHDDMACLLEYLVETGHLRTANVPVPLLEFVFRLTDFANNAQALRNWVDDAARCLGLSTEQIQALGQTRNMSAPQTNQPLYLMLSLAPNDANHQYYTAQAWFVDDRQKHHNVGTVNTRFTTKQVPELLQTALNHPKVQAVRAEADRPLTLEFFLPKHLLDAEIDDWTGGSAPEPDEPPEPGLTYHYNAVVRCWERLPPHNKWTDSWAPYWNKYEACRQQPPSDACVDWVKTPDTRYGCGLDNGKCLFILDFSVTERLQLLTPLSEGVAMLLWSRKKWDDETRNELQNQMKDHRLGELPEALRKVRRKLWSQSGKQHTGHLCLLWDDPHRIPKGQAPDQRLSSPFEN